MEQVAFFDLKITLKIPLALLSHTINVHELSTSNLRFFHGYDHTLSPEIVSAIIELSESSKGRNSREGSHKRLIIIPYS